MNRKILSVCFLLSLSAGMLRAQSDTINPVLRKGGWTAGWITCPGVAQRAYGVDHFRKRSDLPAKRENFIIHVSADNRYIL